MEITRKSALTGIEATMDIDVSVEQIQAWENGVLAQHAMPNLTPTEREFIITGVTQEEWDKYLSDESEEDSNHSDDYEDDSDDYSNGFGDMGVRED